MNVQEWRAQYPGAYDDKTDQEIADALYNKHYVGRIDRADFDQKFLGAPASVESEGNFLVEGAKDAAGWLGNKVKGAGSAIAGAVKGDAEFPDLGTMYDNGYGSIGGTLALTFGDDKDAANAYARSSPELVLSEDKNGNEMFRHPDGSPAGYVNDPGWDLSDAARLGAKAAAFTPAGRAGSLAWMAGRGAMAKAASVGVASAATDVAMQSLAQKDDYDGMQTVLTGILGGAGDLAAPAIGRVFAAAKRRLKGADVDPMEQGRWIARRINRTDLDDDQVRRLGELSLETEGVSDAAGVLAEGEFGYKLTRGQKMREGTKGKYSQLTDERMLRQSDSAGEPLRQIDADNLVNTDNQLRNMTDRFVGGERTTNNAMDAARQVGSNVRTAEKSMKQAVDEAYETAQGYQADLDLNFIKAIPDKVDEAVAASGRFVDDLTPSASKALQRVKEFDSTSLRDVERQRQRLASYYDTAQTNGDRSAVLTIKDAFDEQVDKAVELRLFTGDEKALEELKNARGVARKYFKKFRNKDDAGKEISKILNSDISGEDVAKYMVGINGLSKGTAAQVARRYGEIVGKDSAEYGTLKEMVLYTMTRKRNGDPLGAEALVNVLRQSHSGRGSTLMGELFSEEERKYMRRFGAALARTIQPESHRLRSGSPEGITQLLLNIGGKRIPMASAVQRILDDQGVKHALSAPRLEVRRMSPVPILNATTATLHQN